MAVILRSVGFRGLVLLKIQCWQGAAIGCCAIVRNNCRRKKVIMKMSSDALRWLFTLSSKVSINRRTRGGGWAIALHTLRVFKRDKQADGETEKFVSVAIDYCLSFGFILFWNAIDITAVSQRDNHHALVLCSKEPLHQNGKRHNTFA